MDLPTSPTFRLDGKRALVAGASSGIGQACAVALAEHGAAVTLAAATALTVAHADEAPAGPAAAAPGRFEPVRAGQPFGVVVDYAHSPAAVAEALKDGRMLGAGMDVFTAEPPGSSPLFDLETAVLSPHCAGATLNNFAAIAARAMANAEAYLDGKALPESDVVIDPRGDRGK